MGAEEAEVGAAPGCVQARCAHPRRDEARGVEQLVTAADTVVDSMPVAPSHQRQKVAAFDHVRQQFP